MSIHDIMYGIYHRKVVYTCQYIFYKTFFERGEKTYAID